MVFHEHSLMYLNRRAVKAVNASTSIKKNEVHPSKRLQFSTVQTLTNDSELQEIPLPEEDASSSAQPMLTPMHSPPRPSKCRFTVQVDVHASPNGDAVNHSENSAQIHVQLGAMAVEIFCSLSTKVQQLVNELEKE